jgi:hypothetical protein
MSAPKFTTVIALDWHHYAELRIVAPTWAKHKQAIYRNPLLCFCDDDESAGWWHRKIAIATGHPNIEVVEWPWFDSVNQRHRMLSAFTWGVAQCCETEWHFKLDTDVTCHPGRKWPHPSWFGSDYAWIGHKWNYTKPVTTWETMQKWAATVPAFDGLPEVEGAVNTEKNRVWHPRLISYAMFGRTSFAKELASLAPVPGPVPTHDGLWWYAAQRLGRKFARINMKKFGFQHGGRRLAERAKAAMEG